MDIIRTGSTGSAVYDVQRRLRMLGYELQVDSVFGDKTRAAVEAFRQSEGLPTGDEVDEATWNALVDATFALGDRMLYLRMPYFHGQDVRSLQGILDVLGFVTGDPDGIFGPHTERALREFQASAGITDDGIAGASTYDAIERLRHAWADKQAAGDVPADRAYMGLARAFEALQDMEACFYGLDEAGRAVAARIANLARATTPTARVMCADELDGVPHASMLLVGVSSPGASTQEGVPMVAVSADYSFSKRLATALELAGAGERRLVVELLPPADSLAQVSAEQWQQHLAVLVLDAFCNAFSR